MVMMGSLQGKSKCTSTSDEAAANPQPHSHHMNLCIGPTVPGAGKCEILSLKVHLFLRCLIEIFFTPRSATSAKQPVHSFHHGALVLAMKMVLATMRLTQSQNRDRKFCS